MNRITKVTIRNYKNLQDVTAELGDLNVLVGQNGSGKSNFLDALAFVRDILKYDLKAAGQRRFYNWPTQSKETGPTEIIIDLHIAAQNARYGIVLDTAWFAAPRIIHEYCSINGEIQFERKLEDNKHTMLKQPYSIPSHLLVDDISSLSFYSGIEEIFLVYHFLRDIQIHYISPQIVRLSQLTRSALIEETGVNLLYGSPQLLQEQPHGEDFKATLRKAAPHISDIQLKKENGSSQLVFITHNQTEIPLLEESDGTLRILGILLALYQEGTSLLAIEEPEQTIHPGALAVICDTIKEAATRRQVIITTHSPDLISRFDVNDLRIVERTENGTKISMLDPTQKEAVEQQLFTTGDLLRIDGTLRAESGD